MKALCAACVFSLLLPGLARADAMWVESLDWMVADSHTVVRGAITNVDEKTGKGWSAITMKVEETFKGQAKGELVFADRWGTAAFWQALRKETVEVLVFLVDTNRYPIYVADLAPDPNLFPLTLRSNQSLYWSPSLVRLDGKGERGIYTLEGKEVKKREEILRAVFTAAAFKTDKVGKHVSLQSPGLARFPLMVEAPVDARLEKQARAWAKIDDYDFRSNAVTALKHFKSKENIEVLKSLLVDGQVRKQALAVLREWGVEVESPEVEKGREKK